MIRLHTERLKRNLSLKIVAEDLGITHQHLSFLEHGKRKPSWELQQRLVQYFGISAEKLLSEDVSEPA